MQDGLEKSNLFFPPKSEPKPKSESEKIAESRLTPENVQRIYDNAKKDGDCDRPVFVSDSINEVAFNKNKLEEYRDTIEKLADQLQEDLYNKDTLGADIEYAYYKKGTLGVDIEHAYHNNIKLESAWTKDNTVRNQLLALITAIGLGGVTSPRIMGSINYLIDKEAYKKERARLADVYGDATP